MAMPVSIIACGIHTAQGKVVVNFAKKYPERFHEAIDIRRLLPRNPAKGNAYNTDHFKNVDHLATQLGLLHDVKFFGAVAWLLETIEEKSFTEPGKVFVVYCTAGMHRSQGASKAVSDRVLNEIVASRSDQRRYNSKVFTCEDVGASAEEAVLKQASNEAGIVSMDVG